MTEPNGDLPWRFWRYEDGEFTDVTFQMEFLTGERQEMVREICPKAQLLTHPQHCSIWAISWERFSIDDEMAVDRYIQMAKADDVSDEAVDDAFDKLSAVAQRYYFFKSVWRCGYMAIHDVGRELSEVHMVFIKSYGDLLAYANMVNAPVGYGQAT